MASFDKENVPRSAFSSKQEIKFRFKAKTIFPKHLGFVKIDSEEDMPTLLRQFPEARKQCKREQLWALDLDYMPEQIVAEGSYDIPQFKDPQKLQAIQLLRQTMAVDSFCI